MTNSKAFDNTCSKTKEILNNIIIGHEYKFLIKGNIEANVPTEVFIGKITEEYDKYYIVEKYPEVSYGRNTITTILKGNIICQRTIVKNLK